MVSQRGLGDVGSTLRAARERRGLSLRQIATATKISIIALEALERNDITKLPGGLFSRAFVRSYALEVGLDPETTIQEFMGQFPQDSVTAGHPTGSQIEDHEAVESDRRAATAFLRLLAISVPIAAAVLYFGVSGRRASTRPAASPFASAPPPIAPRPPPEARLPAAEGVAGEGVAAGVAVPPAAVPADQLLVQVSAARQVWISGIVDGRRVPPRTFQPGEHQTFEVRREMVLTAGDAAAAAVTINGAPAKPLGATGKVATLRINLTNYKDFLAAP